MIYFSQKINRIPVLFRLEAFTFNCLNYLNNIISWELVIRQFEQTYVNRLSFRQE